MLKCYFSSKVIPWVTMWSAIRLLLAHHNIEVTSSWLDWPLNYTRGQVEPTAEQFRVHWEKCTREASEADVTIFYDASENQKGSFIE
jgi:hypothetical protein